ncbi:LacI family DNA-binding transcriptional regulator [Hyalangium rubrum]|uniref:LacI family DNA-binding transcriptional regulator n=1 Tax=Hyalangium rubrum TaxID=3103134 RepID=A0ABU5H6V1_9BACT|nr:LacI family DNA-binding transcriptional regulator [Hyalangium sp. s54d21]MDY7228819.1 LacI family DNA-binding transcriptional regulator [Hyalangium sp. s54d21]
MARTAREGSQASIKDVARKARVSIASVSRVMNGHDTVGAETRKRVLAAVRSLHYVPHSGARSLATQRTNVVGVLLPDLHGEFFSELIRGIDAVARLRRLQLLLSSTHGDAAELAVAIRTMRGRVDGLLVMSPHVDAALLDKNLPSSLPIVLLNSPLEDARHSTLTIDSYRGARAMVRHLVGCGHRRIAHAAGPELNLDAQERLRGYRDEMASALPGVPPQVLPGDFSEKSGYLAGQRLAAQPDHPDAVFAANDVIAVGCMVAFREAGLRVPDDIAVAGFDDIPLASLVSPALTTVRVQIAALGRSSLEQLLLSIESPTRSRPVSRALVPEVVVRESCGAEKPPKRRSRRPAVRLP